MPDVFVSYKSEERALVLPLVRRLQGLGLDVWFDTQIQVGEHFDDQIEAQLRSARSVIVCWSKLSVASNWVIREATVADLANTIIPVFIEQVDPPGPFARREGSRLIGWSGDSDHPEWRLLLASLERVLGRGDLVAADASFQRGLAPEAHFREERVVRARRRLLSLDAAGSRVFFQLACLKRLEAILRERERKPDLVLADYFDLIGGSSLGGLVAALLALGRDVHYVEAFMERALPKFYRGDRRVRWGLMEPKFIDAADTQAIRKMLDLAFGSTQFSSPEFKTGVALCMKRVDSGAPWILTNNSLAASAPRNSNFLVKEMVAACIARPGRMGPQETPFGGAFIDGMFAGLANPSLELLKSTTLPEHRLNWKLSEDRLLVLSVGAGSWSSAIGKHTLKQLGRRRAAQYMTHSLIRDTIRNVHETMQMLARPLENFGMNAPLFSYWRFDFELRADAVSALLGRPLKAQSVLALTGFAELLTGKNLQLIQEIGQAYAKQHIGEEVLPTQLDLKYERT